jgi:hypothetical protein
MASLCCTMNPIVSALELPAPLTVSLNVQSVCSLTLFPPPTTATSDSASKDTLRSTRTDATQKVGVCGKTAAQASQTVPKKGGKGSQKSVAAAEAQVSELTLDWSNTCVFLLSTQESPTVQCPPEWPLGCSAAVVAAYASESILRTDDYLAMVRLSVFSRIHASSRLILCCRQ